MRGRGKRHVLSGRETATQREVEAAQQEETQQPSSRVNERGMRCRGAGKQETTVQQENQRPAQTM